MPTDLDIYRGAKLLIDQHGQDATHKTAIRAVQRDNDVVRSEQGPGQYVLWQIAR